MEEIHVWHEYQHSHPYDRPHVPLRDQTLGETILESQENLMNALNLLSFLPFSLLKLFYKTLSVN